MGTEDLFALSWMHVQSAAFEYRCCLFDGGGLKEGVFKS
jgi:hypothetical protein